MSVIECLGHLGQFVGGIAAAAIAFYTYRLMVQSKEQTRALRQQTVKANGPEYAAIYKEAQTIVAGAHDPKKPSPTVGVHLSRNLISRSELLLAEDDLTVFRELISAIEDRVRMNSYFEEGPTEEQHEELVRSFDRLNRVLLQIKQVLRDQSLRVMKD